MEANKTFTIKEVSRLLGFSTNTIYKYVNEGRISATRLDSRGRFRIPESEVAKLLKIKGGLPQEENGYSEESSTEFEDQPENSLSLRNRLLPEDGFLTSAQNFFPWMASLLALVLGFSLFLFPFNLFDSSEVAFAGYFSLLRYFLVFLGFVAIVSEVIAFSKRGLLKFIHFLLAGTFLLCAFIFWQIGGLTCAFISVSVSGLLVSNELIPGGEYRKVLVLINLLFFLLGGVLLFQPNLFGDYMLTLVSQNKLLVGLLWFGVFALSLFFSFVSLTKEKLVWKLIPASLFFAAGFIVSLLSFNNAGFLSRIIFVGFFLSLVSIVPFFEDFKRYSADLGKEKIKCLISTTFFLILALIMAFVVNLSITNYFLNDLKMKAGGGTTLIEHFMDEAKIKTLAFSQNSFLLNELSTAEISRENLRKLLRTFFTSAGSSFIRIYLINEAGKLVEVYPYDASFENLDLSDRAYFQKVKEGQDFYLSEGLRPKANPFPVPAVLIMTAPVKNLQGDLLGVLSTSIDLVQLKNDLDKIKLNENASFEVTDNLGNYVIHKNPNLVLTNAQNGLLFKEGQRLGYNEEGELSYQAFHPLPSLNWGLKVEEPWTDYFFVNLIAASLILFSFMVLNVSLIMQIHSSGKKK